ncbi:hypothetical protein NSU02_06340 [Aeribacillus sp. FSL W8-0870]|uniref:hypothetical protein n=1 Tax=Aeribacillus sp. FSL W8-0870 TaxID=2954706 RepID=UPI0030CAB37B
MQTIDEHRKEVHILEEDSHNYKFILIKYPNNPNEKAVYQCIAGHFFEMKPDEFLKNKQCPICEIDENISRKTKEYNLYLQKVKKYNDGKCELTNDTKNVVVHHLYSIRKYPELAYHPDNAILLNRTLHKEYHRKYSPYNTNGYTFLAWLNDNIEKFGIAEDSINRLSIKVQKLMNVLENEIASKRGNKLENSTPKILNSSVTNMKELQKMERKANRLIENIEAFETIEIIENEVYLLNSYLEAFVIYRNDFGNWNEYNPISGSIPKNVFEAVMDV